MVYKELLLQITHYNLIKREQENLCKHDIKSIVFISSIYFYSIIASSDDQQLLFLMVTAQQNHTASNPSLQLFSSTPAQLPGSRSRQKKSSIHEASPHLHS